MGEGALGTSVLTVTRWDYLQESYCCVSFGPLKNSRKLLVRRVLRRFDPRIASAFPTGVPLPVCRVNDGSPLPAVCVCACASISALAHSHAPCRGTLLARCGTLA